MKAERKRREERKGEERNRVEKDTREWNEVRLEFVEVHVEGAVEAEGGGERGDNLGDQAVDVGIGRHVHVEPRFAYLLLRHPSFSPFSFFLLLLFLFDTS